MLANRMRASLGRVCSAAVLCAVLGAIPNASAAQASAPAESAAKPAAGSAIPAKSPAAPSAPGVGAAPADKPEDTSGTVASPAPSAVSASAAAAPEPGSAPGAQALSADDVVEPPAPIGTATDARRVTELKAQLQHESAQHVNNLWPWLTLGVGAGAVLVGALGGAGYVLACDGECGTTPWVSVLVVAGAGVATLGTIWLLRINADNAQVESRTRRLERELDRLDHAAGLRNRAQARAAPIVSLHF
jgi:hypothetical protein